MASGNGSGFARWSKKQCNVLAVGKSHRARSALSEGKDAPWTTLSGSEDEFSDLEKQKRKLLKGSAWAVDVSKLPERVPTDDTSGYQESQAELIADAIDESKTEQCVYRPRPGFPWCRKLNLSFFLPPQLAHPVRFALLGRHRHSLRVLPYCSDARI